MLILDSELRQALSTELALRLGTCAGHTVFDLLNPMALSDVTAKTISAARAKGRFFLENHAMLKIVQVTQKQLSDCYIAATEVMITECRNKGSAFAEMITSSMELAIGEFEIQVQELIGQMEKGQEEVEYRKAELAS